MFFNSWSSILSFKKNSLLNEEQDRRFFLPSHSFLLLWEEALWCLLFHCCATWALIWTMLVLPHSLVLAFFGYLEGVRLLKYFCTERKAGCYKRMLIFLDALIISPTVFFFPPMWLLYGFSSGDITAPYSFISSLAWCMKDPQHPFSNQEQSLCVLDQSFLKCILCIKDHVDSKQTCAGFCGNMPLNSKWMFAQFVQER